MRKFYALIFTLIYLVVLKGNAQNISVNTTGLSNSTLSMFEVLQISTTANTKGLYISHSGAASPGYGLWVDAANKYAIVVPAGGGNVGIGTTTPATLFNISGAHSTTQARLTLPAANNGGGTGDVHLQLWASEPGITWDAGGIGTNVTNDGGAPAGFGRLNAGLGQSYIRFITNGGAMAFNTTNNAGTYYQTMYMTGGNVGIGTTAPGFKLHVPSGYIGTDYINTTDNAVGAGVTGVMIKAGDNYLRTGNAAAVNAFLGITAPTGDNLGNHIATMGIKRNDHATGFLEGSYNNIGANDTKSNPIYTIGSSYNPTNTTLSNMYGTGYSHSNFWGGASNMPGGWGQYVAAAGAIRVILEANSGIVWAASDVRAPIFYDINNMGYYLDMDNGSNVNYATANDWYVNNWFRVNGGGGIYWQAYGGGWYMQDATWVRGYNGKSLWMGSGLIGGDGGLTIGYGGAGSPGGGAIIAGPVYIGTTTPSTAYKLRIDNTVALGGQNVTVSDNNGTSGGALDGVNYSAANGYNAIEGVTYGTFSGVWGLHAAGGGGGYGVYGSTNAPATAWGMYAGQGGIYCGAGSFWASDKRFKKDIKDLPDGTLNKILQLQPSEYYYNTEEYPVFDGFNGKRYGLIAQELEKIFPEVVNNKKYITNPKKKITSASQPADNVAGYYSVDYVSLIPILIKGIQEQQTMIAELKKQNEALQKRMTEVENKK